MRDRLRACEAFLLDMDGTLYVDDTLVPGARELVTTLEARGKRVLYLTNNSSARAEDYRARLARLGVPVRAGQVLTSGDATIAHLLRETSLRAPYVLGTPALVGEMRAARLDVDAEHPDCVVVGFDRTLTWERLARACSLISAGLPYFATHPDRTCITRSGLVPDAGAIVAAIETATGRTPVVIGKPTAHMVRAALRRLGAQVELTAMIGDQLDTDMAMARAAGLCGVLVMTGETDEPRLTACPAERRPDLVARDVGEVASWLAGPALAA